MLYGYMPGNMENEILDCLMNIGDKIGFPFLDKQDDDD